MKLGFYKKLILQNSFFIKIQFLETPFLLKAGFISATGKRRVLLTEKRSS